jgi:hypothetical protein
MPLGSIYTRNFCVFLTKMYFLNTAKKVSKVMKNLYNFILEPQILQSVVKRCICPKWHFPTLAFPQDGICPRWHFPKMIYSRDGIFPRWHLHKMGFAQHGIFPRWHFPKMAFSQDGIFPRWYILEMACAKYVICPRCHLPKIFSPVLISKMSLTLATTPPIKTLGQCYKTFFLRKLV